MISVLDWLLETEIQKKRGADFMVISTEALDMPY